MAASMPQSMRGRHGFVSALDPHASDAHEGVAPRGYVGRLVRRLTRLQRRLLVIHLSSYGRSTWGQIGGREAPRSRFHLLVGVGSWVEARSEGDVVVWRVLRGGCGGVANGAPIAHEGVTQGQARRRMVWASETTAPCWRGLWKSSMRVIPTQNRLRRRERRQLGQHGSAELLTLLGQEPALGVRELQAPRAEAFAEHPVLGLQVRDGKLLPPMDPTGHQKDEKLERSGRLRRFHDRAR